MASAPDIKEQISVLRILKLEFKKSSEIKDLRDKSFKTLIEFMFLKKIHICVIGNKISFPTKSSLKILNLKYYSKYNRKSN